MSRAPAKQKHPQLVSYIADPDLSVLYLCSSRPECLFVSSAYNDSQNNHYCVQGTPAHFSRIHKQDRT
ncbi:hypothetical protein CUN85_07440 [Methanolobus halotolerans]|uniref:Uncharacterized protein n=1 Tax=Methanolobus halotolerans TaxID=2052935 RepID=A0A4E0PZB9_9EURY|nr:hypothetical protein CUN85_07440 [Methanolobus halotolerans]